MLVALATTLSFTSCEDVPAPYDIPTGGNTGGGTTVDTEGDGTEANLSLLLTLSRARLKAMMYMLRVIS